MKSKAQESKGVFPKKKTVSKGAGSVKAVAQKGRKAASKLKLPAIPLHSKTRKMVPSIHESIKSADFVTRSAMGRNALNEMLPRLLRSIKRHSGAKAVQEHHRLDSIPNIVLEPDFRQTLNTSMFRRGGGLLSGTINPSWTIGKLAKVLAHLVSRTNSHAAP